MIAKIVDLLKPELYTVYFQSHGNATRFGVYIVNVLYNYYCLQRNSNFAPGGTDQP